MIYLICPMFGLPFGRSTAGGKASRKTLLSMAIIYVAFSYVPICSHLFPPCIGCTGTSLLTQQTAVHPFVAFCVSCKNAHECTDKPNTIYVRGQCRSVFLCFWTGSIEFCYIQILFPCLSYHTKAHTPEIDACTYDMLLAIRITLG